jgi:dTDP-4-dehydrorhamnose 3,5-epimerase
MVWGTMHDFSSDCVLLVLANELYSDADYIRSYADFKRILSS